MLDQVLPSEVLSCWWPSEARNGERLHAFIFVSATKYGCSVEAPAIWTSSAAHFLKIEDHLLISNFSFGLWVWFWWKTMNLNYSCGLDSSTIV
jgi:hypothetical protein